TLDMDLARKTSAIFEIPKPTIVRTYRGCEPKGNVFGDTPLRVAYQRPTTHHDVVVFSYLDTGRPECSIESGKGVIAAAKMNVPDTINWIIYSSEQVAIFDASEKHLTDPLNVLLKSKEGITIDFDL